MASYGTKVSSKGQVVIPAELRERYGLNGGTRAVWREQKGQLVLTPVSQLLDELRGSLKPRPGQPSMFDELLKEHEGEREREGKKS